MQTTDKLKLHELAETIKEHHNRLIHDDDQTKKLEKFVTNMNTILLKIGERLESVEADHVRSTMRYNSFREDCQKIISEEVEHRTSIIKEEFVSMEQIRATRVAIRECQLKLKAKVQNKQFQDEINNWHGDLADVNMRISNNDEKLQRKLKILLQQKNRQILALSSRINSCNENIQMLEKKFQVKFKESEREVKYTIDELKQDLSKTLKSSEKELLKKLEELNQNVRLNTIQQLKREADIVKTVQESNRKLNLLISERLQEISKTIEVEKQFNNILGNKMFAQLNNTKANIQNVESKEKKNFEKLMLQQQNITKIDKQMLQVTNQVEDLQYLINKFQQDTVTNNAIDLQALRHQRLITEKKLENQHLSHMQIPEIKNQESKKSKELTEQKLSVQKLLPLPITTEKQFRKQTQKIQTLYEDALQAKSPLFKDRKKIATFHDDQKLKEIKKQLPPVRVVENNVNEAQVKILMQGFRSRVQDMEQNITVLRQIIEAKANQSDLLKIQQTKCTKFAFKQLMKSLTMFKNILQNILPPSELIKEFKFEDIELGQLYGKLIRLKNTQSPPKQIDSPRKSNLQANLMATLYPPTSRRRNRQTFYDRTRGESITSRSSRQNGIL